MKQYFYLLITILFFYSLPAFGQHYPIGNEFQVNTYTTQNQHLHDIAINPTTGNFVIVWSSEGQDGSASGVYAQRYDKFGNTIGNEFQVNTYTNNHQFHPSIGIDANGDFTIVWESFGQDGSNFGIYARQYDNQGFPLSNEFLVNTDTIGEQRYPKIAMKDNGLFVVVWQGMDGMGRGIFGQRFGASGFKIGNEFQVNTYIGTTITGHQTHPDVAMDENGNFIVVYGKVFIKTEAHMACMHNVTLLAIL